MWLYARKERKEAQVSAVFLVGYGAARFAAEYFREPDAHLGILALKMSMGQWLCIPMIIGGVLLWVWAETRTDAAGQHPAGRRPAAR
jgi:phosphatidylglycerol:prolipoprotein diacylglycerol transferase